MDEYLTAKELAVMLRVDRWTIYRWAREDGMPAIKLPSGTLRFEWPKVKVWMESQRKPDA